MNESMNIIANSKSGIQERVQAGHITLFWPVLIVFARLFLALFAQALVAGIFMLKGNPNPWQAAAPWWIVYGTLIDIGCIFILIRLTRREGIRFLDLFSFQNRNPARSILLLLGLMVLFFILAIAGGVISGKLIYGNSAAPSPMGPLPLWGALYALLVWPIIWGITEELTYLGYALPRLEVLTGRPWKAVLIVGIGWAVQHCALPLIFDWQWSLHRFLSSLLIAIVFPIIYFRVRRLLPFIIAHWLANFLSVLMLVVLPQL
jgi:membrane protease YdiL (CAAX protease family)